MFSDLCKRIIPCLDVDNGRTVKGVNFQNLRDMGDPVELAARYESEGADELVFLDITATVDGRRTMAQLVSKIADVLSIPFTVGGGIRSLEDVKRLLGSGADKVAVNSAAVEEPGLIEEIASIYGSQCCSVAIDARARIDCPEHSLSGASNVARCSESGWEVLTRAGKHRTGMDALSWGKECVDRGAGEILLTSWDRDGTLTGFDLKMVSAFSSALSIPIIASGGASTAESFLSVFLEGSADAALAATIFHEGTYTVQMIKQHLKEKGVSVRL